MAKQFTFTTRIDTSGVKQDTQVIRQLIEAAFKPVQFKLPSFSQDQIKASSSTTKQNVGDNQKVQREEAVLLVIQQQVEAENKRREVALSGIREQIVMSVDLAEIRLNSEREITRISEQRRQEELAQARSTNGNTTNIEAAHLKERIAEQARLAGLTDAYNAKRLQAERQLEVASSRNAIERIKGEQQVAAAVERVAQARLAEAQTAARTTTDTNAKVAAEQKVVAAIEQVTNAQRERIAITERMAAEEIAAENRIAEATTRSAQERIQAEERVQRARQQVTRQQPGSAGGGKSLAGQVEGVANLLTGGLQALATVQLVRGVANATAALDTLRVQSERSKVSLDILSGGADNASARIQAIKQAGGGVITTMQAVDIAVQSTALGLANSTEEFGRLTTAARAVALVSPVIKDVNSAISEISLAGANQSFRRLDQLGLGVTEVKDKIAELQAADKSLSDQQAFSAAVIDTLNSKYGALLQTTQAQASGQEKLTTAWQDFKVTLADTAPIEAYDTVLGKLALGIERLKAGISGDFVFFSGVDEAKKTIEEIDNAIEKAFGSTARFRDANISVENLQEQQQQLGVLISLEEQANDLRDQQVQGAEELGKTLTQLRGKISQGAGVTDEEIASVNNLALSIAALNSISQSSTAGALAYKKAQETLGVAFINTDESSKTITDALIDVEKRFLQGKISVGEYEKTITSLSQGYYGLSEASKQYQETLAQEEKVKKLVDVESNLVKAVEAEAAQLIESGEDYDKVVKELQAKKEMIRREIENIPADINPDQIPLIVAKIKFEVDQSALDNIDLTGSGSLINTDIVKELQDTAAEARREAREEIKAAKDNLAQDAQSQILGLISQGLDPAEAIKLIGDYKRRVSTEINSIPDDVNTAEFGVKVAQVGNTINDELAKLGESLTLSDINPQFALDDIITALGDLNTAAVDSTPGLSSVRDELASMYDAIASSGTVTQDQADRLNELTAIAFAVGDATGIYADAVSGLNNDLFDTSAEAGGLFSAISQLEGAYVSGKVAQDEYSGRMLALINRMIEVATQAGVTGKALDELIGLKTQLEATGSTLGGGFVTGKQQGEQQVQANTLRTQEATRKEEARQAEKAQREWEKAARSAEQAAQRASAAFESSLQKVPGLFGTSGVTQDQLDLAAAGVPQNFADDFVRRLEDVVVNKKQRSDVSIGDAQQALVNVGVDAANLTGEQVLLLIKQKWNDGSLFSNPDNLKLINFEAVTKNLELQKKGEEGKQAIIDYVKSTYGMAIDDVIGGTGKAATAGALPPGVAAPGAAQIDAAQAQVSASATINLTFSEDAINVAATSAAKLFEKVFTEYDFSTLANAPVSALELSFSDGKMISRVGGFGVRLADIIGDGFANRSSEIQWLSNIMNAMEAQVTNNVLSSLAN